jgi:hypothetical protein
LEEIKSFSKALDAVGCCLREGRCFDKNDENMTFASKYHAKARELDFEEKRRRGNNYHGAVAHSYPRPSRLFD